MVTKTSGSILLHSLLAHTYMIFTYYSAKGRCFQTTLHLNAFSKYTEILTNIPRTTAGEDENIDWHHARCSNKHFSMTRITCASVDINDTTYLPLLLSPFLLPFLQTLTHRRTFQRCFPQWFANLANIQFLHGNQLVASNFITENVRANWRMKCCWQFFFLMCFLLVIGFWFSVGEYVFIVTNCTISYSWSHSITIVSKMCAHFAATYTFMK